MSTRTSSNSGHGHWEASSPPQSSLRLLWLLRRQTGLCFWRAQETATGEGAPRGTAPLPDSSTFPGSLQTPGWAPPRPAAQRGHPRQQGGHFRKEQRAPKTDRGAPERTEEPKCRASRRLPLTHGPCCEHFTGISRGKKCLKWPSGTPPEKADTLAWAEGVEMLWAPRLARPGSAPHDGDDRSAGPRPLHLPPPRPGGAAVTSL